MKAAIVDDEPLARARLKRMLITQNVEVVAEGLNGFDAVQIATDEAIDILFLDINMPGKSGIEAAKEIDSLIHQAPAIVFCTAYDEHALEAFNTNAVSYLLKPFSEADIIRSLDQAQKLSRLQAYQMNDKSPADASIVTARAGEMAKLDISAIIYFYSKDKHVYAGMRDGNDRLVDISLKQLELDLDGSFVRAHRNTLVNIDCITRVYKSDGGGSCIELKGSDVCISISRRHLAGVKKCFV